MLATIELDQQQLLEAGEIDDIATDWRLATEFRAPNLAVAQAVPESPLDLGLIRSQAPGNLVHRRNLARAVGPLTLHRVAMGPSLSHGGGGKTLWLVSEHLSERRSQCAIDRRHVRRYAQR